MKPSSDNEVRKMYEESADSYAEMMDAEIHLPVYADILGRLSERLANIEGPLVDTACGSGHMLSMYRTRFDQERPLLGVDLSPKMVEYAAKKIGDGGRVITGDMRDLAGVEDGVAAAIINFFAMHHLDAGGAHVALREWHRVLRPGGQLVLATWEGGGTIDYGEESDIVALRYSSQEVQGWVAAAGFEITRCEVEPVEEMPMDAIYLEGVRS